MAAILAVICLFGVSTIPVQAATTTDECVGIVLQLDSAGETVDASTAVVVQLDGTLAVFTKVMDGNAEETAAALYTGTGNVYLLEYGDVITVGNYDLSIWGLDESDENYESAYSDTSFLEVTDPHQNDIALAVYLGSESNEVESTAMRLLECDGNGILTVDAYPADAEYPAALVNESGQLVGICLQDNMIWAIRNGEEFYGASGAEAPSEEKAPPLPEREERQPSAPAETKETPAVQDETPVTPESVPSVIPDDPVKKYEPTSQTMTIVVVVVAVVVVAAVVVIVLMSKKKKQSSVPPQTPGASSDPGYGAATQPYNAPDNGAFDYTVSEGPVPVPEASKLWLAAKGGCMNGRVYPIEQHEITIGRDASSNIRYPADTVGVSRVHAKLYWQGGQLMLMDCNSTSGTFLQRQGKLSPMTPVQVRSGDVFYIGEKINSFEIRN